VWYHQANYEQDSGLPTADFWHHNLLAGYRFPRRSAEITLGLLNLFDTDYRLNPLNLHPDLPRGRTFVASLRLNF
jgi:outer membrane receptor protein involved in Fe transport